MIQVIGNESSKFEIKVASVASKVNSKQGMWNMQKQHVFSRSCGWDCFTSKIGTILREKLSRICIKFDSTQFNFYLKNNKNKDVIIKTKEDKNSE